MLEKKIIRGREMNSVAPPEFQGGAVEGAAEFVRTYRAWEGSNVTSMTCCVLYAFYERNLLGKIVVYFEV